MSNFTQPCQNCGKQDALVPCQDCVIHGQITMPNGDIITFAGYTLDDLSKEMIISINDYEAPTNVCITCGNTFEQEKMAGFTHCCSRECYDKAPIVFNCCWGLERHLNDKSCEQYNWNKK